MNTNIVSKTLMVLVLGSVMVSGSALAAQMADNMDHKADNSMSKVGNFMDDSAITAKVKAALVDDEAVKSSDISVTTEHGAVTLTGFVESQAQVQKALTLAKGIKGVTAVHDKLHVRDSKSESVKGYVSDTAITSEVKAKLLADNGVPSRDIKVVTTEGVVQLSGTVTKAQSDRAEMITKAV